MKLKDGEDLKAVVDEVGDVFEHMRVDVRE